ncbi:MAG: SGNH/GDSL hydrolase family protein [Candidatus Nanopelagicales bacterium]
MEPADSPEERWGRSPKRVLAFGDSNTWGFDPATGGRYPLAQCWPGVLGAALGSGADVIVEGLNGRTTVVDSPYAPSRSGATMLGPLLESHAPVDLVIIMLGTNDLQSPLGLTARHAASGIWTLVDITVRSAAGFEAASPAVLVVSPPHIVSPSGFMGVFYEGREQESQELAQHYSAIAAQLGVSFFDAASVVTPGPVDGVHLDPAGHQQLGEALALAARAALP